MDFTELSNDELADASKALVDELHARHASLPPGQPKTRAGRLLVILHRAFDALKEHAVEQGLVQIRSGGDPKPEEP